MDHFVYAYWILLKVIEDVKDEGLSTTGEYQSIEKHYKDYS